MPNEPPRRHWSEGPIAYLIKGMEAEILNERVLPYGLETVDIVKGSARAHAVGGVEDAIADRFAGMLAANSALDQGRVVRRLAEMVGLAVYEITPDDANRGPVLYTFTASTLVSVNEERYREIGWSRPNWDLLNRLVCGIEPAIRYRTTYRPADRSTVIECSVTAAVPRNFKEKPAK